MLSNEKPNLLPASKEPFPTTQWSLVLAACQSDAPDAEAALATLCRTYWYPLYAYIRRRGYSYDDAQDLTQEFFARLLERKDLGAVEPRKGRFRSFLLAALNHFLANEWDRARARKRGGGLTFVPLDVEAAESRYGLEPVDDTTPEKIFERHWALTLLERTLIRLRQKYAAAGQAQLFDQLKVYLAREKSPAPYADVAAELSMSEGAIKVAVHRMRRRYRELLREEIVCTVAAPDEIDEELRHLIAVLSASMSLHL